MQAHGDGGKSIWATEVGLEAMFQGLGEEHQALAIKMLLEQHAKNGEGPMIIYQAQNDRAPYVQGIISRDADGNGRPDVNIDTDGDGRPDANLDDNDNGIPDLLDQADKEDYFGLWTHDGQEKPAVDVIRHATGQAGGVKPHTLTVDILDDGANPTPNHPQVPPAPNHTPTHIDLDNLRVMEGKDGAVVGKLTTNDPDAGDTHTYSISDARFEVVGNQLKLKDNQAIEFAREPTINLEITAYDSAGESRMEKFTLNVQDDPASPAPLNASEQFAQAHIPAGEAYKIVATLGEARTAANDAGLN